MTQTYALIDGVKRQTAIKEVYESQDPVQVIPLYMGTRFQENYDLGPILVASLNGQLIPKLQENDWPQSTSLVTSNQTMTQVAEHLKQLISITNELGTESLFRFADPLITWYWLNSYTEQTLVDIMGPIDTWQIAKPSYAWENAALEWQTITKPNLGGTNQPINKLGQIQLQALEQAAHHQFKNKMYLWLQQENPAILQDKTTQQINQWLEHTITSGKDYNLTNDRTLAMWVDLTADYGETFATDTNSPYQQWLTQNTHYKALPADVKIEQYYDQLSA